MAGDGASKVDSGDDTKIWKQYNFKPCNLVSFKKKLNHHIKTHTQVNQNLQSQKQRKTCVLFILYYGVWGELGTFCHRLGRYGHSSHLFFPAWLRDLGEIHSKGNRIRGLTVLWEKSCNSKRSSGNHFPRRALVFEILSHSWSNKALVHWTSKDDLKQLVLAGQLWWRGCLNCHGVKMFYFSLIIWVFAQDSSQGRMGFILWEMNISVI